MAKKFSEGPIKNTTKPGKATGKAGGYDAVITDPGYGRNPSVSNRNNAKNVLLDGRRTVGSKNMTTGGTTTKKPTKASAAVDRQPISKTPSANIGRKLDARLKTSVGTGNKVGSKTGGFDAVITDPGYGRNPSVSNRNNAKNVLLNETKTVGNTGLVNKPGKATGKYREEYTTPGFKPTKKTSKK